MRRILFLLVLLNSHLASAHTPHDDLRTLAISPNFAEDGMVFTSLNYFDNYLLKSTDRGRSWKSITANLPDRGTVYCIAEDHEKPGLLFVGTEFALYFTIDGGQKWVQLKGGLPVTQMRDLAIQKRENDLVVATFGRGFYVLDDYTPLRNLTKETLEKAIIVDQEYVKTNLELIDEGEVLITDYERLKKGVYFTFEGLVRTMLSIKYPEEWQAFQQ